MATTKRIEPGEAAPKGREEFLEALLGLAPELAIKAARLVMAGSEGEARSQALGLGAEALERLRLARSPGSFDGISSHERDFVAEALGDRSSVAVAIEFARSHAGLCAKAAPQIIGGLRARRALEIEEGAPGFLGLVEPVDLADSPELAASLRLLGRLCGPRLVELASSAARGVEARARREAELAARRELRGLAEVPRAERRDDFFERAALVDPGFAAAAWRGYWAQEEDGASGPAWARLPGSGDPFEGVEPPGRPGAPPAMLLSYLVATMGRSRQFAAVGPGQFESLGRHLAGASWDALDLESWRRGELGHGPKARRLGMAAPASCGQGRQVAGWFVAANASASVLCSAAMWCSRIGDMDEWVEGAWLAVARGLAAGGAEPPRFELAPRSPWPGLETLAATRLDERLFGAEFEGLEVRAAPLAFLRHSEPMRDEDLAWFADGAGEAEISWMASAVAKSPWEDSRAARALVERVALRKAAFAGAPARPAPRL